jgi:hypothetical protein
MEIDIGKEVNNEKTYRLSINFFVIYSWYSIGCRCMFLGGIPSGDAAETAEISYIYS